MTIRFVVEGLCGNLSTESNRGPFDSGPRHHPRVLIGALLCFMLGGAPTAHEILPVQ